MKRLLTALCLLAAAWPVPAREPVKFDLPCAIEDGYYVVWLGTPAGPRRFLFDTGCGRTTIRESLRRELSLTAQRFRTAGDFEGHSEQVGQVVIDSLRMGPVVFRRIPVHVLPDSSYIFRCLGFDGIAGSDLLQDFAVRIPNADSTITITDDIRQLGPLNRREAARLRFAGKCPVVVPRLCDGNTAYTVYMKFDTGSPGFFNCRYDESLVLIDKHIAQEVRRTEGHPGNLGWTNRSVMNEVVRGVIPGFELAGQTLVGMPFKATHGESSKLGCGIFRWGTVVVDYPGRRFWLLPHAGQPAPPEVPVQGVTVALDGGRLVVGQVWDESLAEVVAPGDRIVCVGTQNVEHLDVCAFIRGEVHGDKPELTVERRDGTRVTVPVKNL